MLAGQPNLETQQRLKKLLEKLVSNEGSKREPLRVLRALEVLERAGTPAARTVLEAMAKGAPESRLTQNAKASVQRLTQQP